jgi:hypothetical protein
MNNKYFFLEAREIESKPDIHLFIVFDNDVSAVRFDIDDDPDVYYLEDERLDNEELWKAPADFYEMFLEDLNVAGEQGRRIIVIHYNTMVAQCTAAFFKEFKGEKRIRWHALSFFHNDEDTEYLGLNWTDVLLAKVYAIDSLNYFPWIEKIEVPPDKHFCHRDLLKLVLDEAAFKELDNEDEEPYTRLDNDKPPQVTWALGKPC